MTRTAIQQALVDRFMRYTAIPSQSQAGTGQVPSTPGQWDMVRLLQNEMESMQFQDIFLSEHGVLIGHIPTNTKRAIPPIGFVAHVDTVDVNLSPEIHAQIVRYNGGDICLNAKDDIYLRESEHPEILPYLGQELLVSDGHSVLGADNKAAIATILTAIAQIQQDPNSEHGDIYVAFVPDEEIGLVGAKHMPFEKFPVTFAYTIDCCQLGEVVYETFNAGSAHIHIQGVSAHPMSAKGVLVNPTLIAVDLVNLFDRLQTPENTEGTEGYIWPQQINSNQSTADVILNIRDHNKEKYEAKKSYIQDCVAFLQKRYPRAKITLSLEDTYGNIADALTDANRYCVDYIYKGMENLGIEPKTIAMRGGTDGSFLSTQGIPTPNYFTGAHNFHSPYEFLPLPAFEKSYELTRELIRLVAEEGNTV